MSQLGFRLKKRRFNAASAGAGRNKTRLVREKERYAARRAAGFAVLLELVEQWKGSGCKTQILGRKKEFFGKLWLAHNGSLSAGAGGSMVAMRH
ncbi:hypothetical protein AMECASPLE_010522 [Ameca splendens]|uniref:Uncharacterized protein n=1 Tax=Ameca splendens TaxID=208324 RepID=A0ABV0XDK5_9TELE